MRKTILVCTALLLLCVSLSGCFAKPEKPAPPQPVVTTTAAATTANPAAPVTPAGSTTTATGVTGEYPFKAYATDSLNVRRTPNLDYSAIGGLDAGDEVTIIGKEGDFYKIEWKSMDGNYSESYAYVSAQYISKDKNGTTTAGSTTAAPTVAPTTVSPTTKAN